MENGGVAAVKSGGIQILPPEEARKIAAGEVIDRPAALVREFLDNAIDAGASLVEVEIEGGGSRRVEVIDNGTGMDREDLALCWQTHATSKIRTLEDLNTAETLGFRGEALAAAAAVSRLEILTSRDGREAWRLGVGPAGRDMPRLEPIHRAKGTSVRALGLFDTIPVRKRFLKREASEGGLCRQAFIDKALVFPELGFRFTQEGKLKTLLSPVSGYKERFASLILTKEEEAFLYEINAGGPGFSVAIVMGGPELYRHDRRQQYVFANGRRIQDFSLLQALEYGLQGWFPNGTHPLGGIYLEIEPKLADFNIHPAKREVRFADPGAIHHRISSALLDFTRRRNTFLAGEGYQREPAAAPGPRTPEFPGGNFRIGPGSGSPGFYDRREAPGTYQHSLAMEALLNHPPHFAPLPGRGGNGTGGMAAENTPPYRASFEGDPSGDVPSGGTGPENGGPSPVYAGRLFGLFILMEWGDRAFIIDQHAAHERVLFDAFLSKPIPRQELLIAIPFTTESGEEDQFLTKHREELAKLGIVIEKEDNTWRIESLPAAWRTGDTETVAEILNLRFAGENMAERWAATLSCHAAVKDGDYLDDTAALALGEAALKLPVPRCPHGRPVWVEICREELFRQVKRT
ncbi:MAG: DNA mismatch repair endonuclease MutL [Treponema sp.]|jgi:DNA mismatch repair protein MutL|nr:DNA mismatch repair endonuclease MutL [Treponema sp.]